jgi:hypothetical protein
LRKRGRMSYAAKNTSNDFFDPVWLSVLVIKEQKEILNKQGERIGKLLFEKEVRRR